MTRMFLPKPGGIPRYLTIEELISCYIDEPNRSACFKILEDNRKLFQTVQGSSHNHQAWPGGYYDHVQEVMNIAIILYGRLNYTGRKLPFVLSDALLVLFLHDIEKPWKYKIGPNGELHYIESLRTKEAQHAFRQQKLTEYGIILTSDQENALKYVEGELNDYSNKRRMMGPLAAFCHLADVTSARIWYDYPREKGDPWLGAKRHKEQGE